MYPKSQRNTVKRAPKRGHYDRETIYQILDAGFICHAGFNIQEQPYVLPTAYGREGDTIYLHGAISNRMLGSIEKGIPVCITVTHLDGLVLARSAFHHSFNYRSVLLFGTAQLIEEEEQKDKALLCITEQILKGRWQEVRQPNEQELKITKVLAFEIEEASAKIRTGGPNDDDEDYQLPIWAGVVPLTTEYHAPVTDPKLTQELAYPDSVKNVTNL